MEKNIENYTRRLLTKTGAIAAVAGLAFSGCSPETKDGEWIFAVSCLDEQEVRIGDISTAKGTEINITCGNSEETTTPLSVELIEGSGITINQPVNEELQKVTVGYEYTTNSWGVSQNPIIDSIKINQEDSFAQIALLGMSITEVSVSEK